MSLIAKDDNDDDFLLDTFGGRIVRARETAKLSTAQLARRAGVLTETLQAWESDRLMPRTNQIVKLSGLLNVSPTWLLVERGSLLTVVGGLERIEKRLEQYESYR